MTDAPLPSSFDRDVEFYEENRWQKFTRRLKEEPLIPVGVALTCWAFFGASQSMRKGDGARTNQFFRYRLYAQSFTLVAMLGGSLYYNADRLKRKEYTSLVKQKKEQDKRDAWIRELEARDLEDKEWREKLGKVRDVKREEAEKAAMEEKRRNDDGKGLIEAVKAKLKDAKELETARETAEQKPDVATAARQKRQEMQRKQEVVRQRQATAMEQAGMGKPKVWGEAGGGLFGWRRIRDFWYSRKGSGSEDDKPADS